jgi:hypothetical protein
LGKLPTKLLNFSDMSDTCPIVALHRSSLTKTDRPIAQADKVYWRSWDTAVGITTGYGPEFKSQ